MPGGENRKNTDKIGRIQGIRRDQSMKYKVRRQEGS